MFPSASARLSSGPARSLAILGSTDGACISARLCMWPLVTPSNAAMPRGHASDLHPMAAQGFSQFD